MTASRSRIISLSLDAIDTPRMAQFWAKAIGWEIGEFDDDIALVPNDGTGFAIIFEPITDAKVGRNNVQLDLATTSFDDQRDHVARLIQAGAHHLDIGEGPETADVVLADPEGNEFRVIGPGDALFVDSARLGAITATGTGEVGVFWSETLGWPLVHDEDGATAIRASDGSAPILRWTGTPSLHKQGKDRVHLDIAPPAQVLQRDEVDRLIALGASRLDIGQGDVSWVVMADPGEHEFCVLTPR